MTNPHTPDTPKPPRTARISPATAPHPPEVQAWLDRATPQGWAPLALFTALARDPRLFGKFFAANLVDRGNVSVRQREIVIHRTTALCGAEYEWGAHVALFSERAALTDAQLASTVHGGPDDACWPEEERVLLRLCDALHREVDVDDTLWTALRAQFSEEAVIELLMLAGYYRTVAYLVKGLRLPLEPQAARFPVRA